MDKSRRLLAVAIIVVSFLSASEKGAAGHRLNSAVLDALAAQDKWQDVLETLAELPLQERAKPLSGCYQALSYYGLNQVTAGTNESLLCAQLPAVAARTAWTARLRDAQAAAGARVDDLMTTGCSELLASASKPGGSVGCNSCADVDKTKAALRQALEQDAPRQSVGFRSLAVEPQRLKERRQEQLAH